MIDVNGLRGDMVIYACLRSDLAPIPLTFEGTIRTTQQTAVDFKDGALITINEVPFRIVESLPANNVGVQGKEPISATKITAFPDSIVEVARPRKSAVIFKNATLAGIYRACGASVPIAGDFGIERYACLIGGEPTMGIAQALQEASAVVMWRTSKIQAMNLRDVFQQSAITNIDIDGSQDFRSDFLVSGEVPTYFSTGPDGAFVAGLRLGDAQSVMFSPRKSARTLNAMSRVLVRRKAITIKADPTIRAGDVVNIRGTPFAVMTAAQCMKNGTDGGGVEQYTRLWLGVST